MQMYYDLTTLYLFLLPSQLIVPSRCFPAGIRGVYQGLTATVYRNTVAVSMYFGFYELAKQWLATGDEQKTGLAPWKLMLSGGIGGLAYWPLIYPVDVVKSSTLNCL